MAETEVQMPDGTVLAFPDTMSPEAMQAAAAKYWSDQQGQSTPAQQPAPPTARLSPELAASVQQAVATPSTPAPTQTGVTIPEALLRPTRHGGPRSIDAYAERGFSEAVKVVGEGVILRNPTSGALVFTSPGRNISDQSQVEEMLGDGDMSAVTRDDMRFTLDMPENANIRRGGLAANFLTGLPFVGSYVDEAFGYFGGDEANEKVDTMRDTYATAYPGRATAAQIGGALTTAPIAVANAPRVIGAGSTLSKVGRGLLAGTVLGGTEGAIYGAGQGEEGSRLDNAQTGGLWGAAFGGGIGAAIPALGGLGRTLYNAAAGRKARQAASELGMQQDVAGFVADRVRADAPYAAQNIAQAGESATIGNLGPSTRGLLDAVANAPGQSAAIARQGVEEIVEGASGRFTATLDDVLGAPQGPRATMREIMQESATPRREAYEAAFASPIDYASDAGRNIEAAMRRVDPTDLQAAVREANAQMRDLGVDNMQIRATISDAGEVVFDQMPDVRQINALKQGLDTIAENSKNPFGVMSPQGVRAASQARALRDALGEAVPAYRDALRLGGDAIAERNAVELGRNMLRPRFTREQMAEALDGLGETEIARVRQGLRSQIDDTMANVRRGLTRTDSDPQSVLAPLRQLTAPAAREKVASILGADEASRLFAMLDEAEQAFSMRIVTGSRMAPRLQTEQALRELVPGGLADDVIDKGLIGAASSVAGRVAKAGGQTQEQAMDEIRAYLARTLTETGDVGSRAQQLNDFADLGQRMQQGRTVAERSSQQVGAATLPPVTMGATRPEADNRAATLRRLAEMGYEAREIVQIMQGGPEAIEQALTR